MQRLALLLVLLAACGRSHGPLDGGAADAWAPPGDAWVAIDAGPPDAASPPDASPVDAGPSWAALGCTPVTYCIPQPHLVPVCFASGERDPAECRRWLSCADCYTCREWSSHPFRREPPETTFPDQPECEGSVCPVVDAGGLPGCG